MPSKKKKYNARFPPARIKKIMQTDDEIGKVAAAVPVLISKGLEMFLTSILVHAGDVTKAKRAKTMTTSHLKECILNVGMFDFLKEVVADVPDMQNEQEPTTSSGITTNEESKKLIRKRSSTPAKHPKKLKLSKADHTSEENENTESGSIDSQESMDDQNGLFPVSSHSPSASHLPRSPVERPDNPDHKPSFHIPLDDLMSPESEPVLNTDRVLLIDAPESGTNATAPVLFAPKPDFASYDKRLPASSNGLSSPQNPMDLSLNTQKMRENVSETNMRVHESVVDKETRNMFQPVEQQKVVTSVTEDSAKTAIPRGDQSVTQTAIINPLNMTHLYNPMPALPQAVAESSASDPTPDLAAKIPQGGMLSLLYSNFSGDSFPEMSSHSLANLNPAGVHSDPQHDTSKQSESKAVPSHKGAAYPYNPVAQHQTNMSSLPRHPYMPEPLHMQKVNATIKSSQPPNTEDDDYDA